MGILPIGFGIIANGLHICQNLANRQFFVIPYHAHPLIGEVDLASVHAIKAIQLGFNQPTTGSTAQIAD